MWMDYQKPVFFLDKILPRDLKYVSTKKRKNVM